jgi:hypothetical protein
MSFAACEERCASMRTSDATSIAGARRFDRGVKRQEVGLPGDLVDNADDIGDLAGRSFDLRHCRNRIGHHLAAAIGNVARLGGRLIGLLGVLGVLLHRGRDFLHRRGGFFQARGLLFRPLRQVGRAARDFRRVTSWAARLISAMVWPIRSAVAFALFFKVPKSPRYSETMRSDRSPSARAASI